VQCPRRQIAKTPFGGWVPAFAKTPKGAADVKTQNCQVAELPSRQTALSPQTAKSSQMQVENRRLDTADICLAFGDGRQLSLMSGALDTADNCLPCPVQKVFGKIGKAGICPLSLAPKGLAT
jgi:hypothetical protein